MSLFFGNRGTKLYKLDEENIVSKFIKRGTNTENVRERGNIGQFWKGTRNPPWETLINCHFFRILVIFHAPDLSLSATSVCTSRPRSCPCFTERKSYSKKRIMIDGFHRELLLSNQAEVHNNSRKLAIIGCSPNK